MRTGTREARAALFAAAAAAAIPLAIVPGAAAAAGNGRGSGDCATSGFKRSTDQIEVISGHQTQTITGRGWTDLTCGSVYVQVPRGTHGHLTVWVNAEIRCKGPSVIGNWCGGRIIVDGVSLTPSSNSDNDRFDWDTANPEDRRWRDGSMMAAGYVTCPANNSRMYCNKKIQVQAMNNSSSTTFWIDDTIVRAELLRRQLFPR
ncbi:MAG TPA: hypothetical protein VM347_14015 [Nonomuraea sp.]|nr:hypothetical protein [Nonomuraea sp.]